MSLPPVQSASSSPPGINWQSQCQKTLDWYWTYGRHRETRWGLSMGWLDALYTTQATFRSIDESAGYEKPSVAVWGPSQTGKSTLIGNGLDRNADSKGKGSALHWDNGRPARFSKDATVPLDTTVLNPFNQKSDASGCVTRFVMREEREIPLPLRPVEIKFASRQQVMLALAAGYESECVKTGSVSGLRCEDVEKRMEKLAPASGTVKRESLEALRELVDVLDLLIHARFRRFEALDALGGWSGGLRDKVLGCAPLLAGDMQGIVKFAADLLWDGNAKLSETFAKLDREAQRWTERLAGSKVYASLEAAAMFLDIDAYRQLREPIKDGESLESRMQQQMFKNKAAKLGWDKRGDLVFIDQDLNNPLFSGTTGADGAEQFGLFQGLIWELVVPLNKARFIDEGSRPYREFFEQADLIDFPGVANEQSGVAETLVDLNKITSANEHQLLTRVLKRGKTASIVISYARSLRIDTFLLLNRADRHPSQPAQLTTGLTAWWRYVEPAFNLHDSPPSPPPLPLFLVLTFFATELRSVAHSGVGKGLAPLFEKLKSLGNLSRPPVSTPMATTYNWLPDGDFTADAEKKKRVSLAFKGDASFRGYFDNPQSMGSFDAVLNDADGGVGYLLGTVAKSTDPSRKRMLLDKRKIAAQNELMRLLTEASPDAGATEQRVKRLGGFVETVSRSVQARVGKDTDPAQAASLRLRVVFNISFDALDPIPQNMKDRRTDAGAWARKQLQRWVDSRRDTGNFLREYGTLDLASVGLADETLRTQILSDFADGVDLSMVARWLLANCGYVSTTDLSMSLRRPVAQILANALIPPAHDGTHRPLDEAIEVLKRYADYNECQQGSTLDDSAHWRNIVKPILDYVTLKLLKTSASGRPNMQGDPEIREIRSAAASLLTKRS